MIRINLLKSLQVQANSISLQDPANKRKKFVLVGGGILIVLLGAIAVLQYPSLLGGLWTSTKTAAVAPVAEVPKPVTLDTMQPKLVTANAVEETVRDVSDAEASAAAPPTYGDLVPSEKIEFQYYACSRILKDIKAVTPAEVGYANFIFTPPGDFYVHGLANDDENYQRLKKGLGEMVNTTVRAGLEVPAGVKGLAKEFSFYGTINYPLTSLPTPPDHVVTKVNLLLELKHLKSVAANLGILLQEPKLLSTVPVGENQRMIYETKADCTFQQMQDFLSELHEAKSNLGFLKFALHARGDEKIIAEMDILAYVN